MEKTGDGEKELNRGDAEVKVNENKETSREKEEKIRPDEGEPQQLWEKDAIRNEKRGMWVTIAGEEENVREKKDEDIHLRCCVPRGAKEEKEGKNQMEKSQGQEEMQEKERTEGGGRCEKTRGTLSEVKMGKEEGDEMKFKSQWRSNESHHDRPNSNMMDDDSSCEDCQEKTMVKTLEEVFQDRAVETEDQLALIQVPGSKWEKSGEEVENEVTPAGRETEGQNEQKRQRSVDTMKDRDREKGKDEEQERSLDRSLAPSGGKETSDSTWCADRERERGMEQGRERERGRDRQKETKRSKERTREEEGGRERGHSSQKNLPSSSHFSQHSMRERQQGGDHDHKKSSASSHAGGKHSSSGSRERRAVEMPDKHAHKTQRDTSLDPKRKDRNYHSHRDSPGNKHQDRPAGTHHSSEIPSVLFPSKSSSPKPSQPRMSLPGLKLEQDRSNESKDEKEWTRDKMDREAEAERGSPWCYEDDKWSEGIKCEELEEGERAGSSSSASQDGSNDDRRKRKKKQTERKREMNQAGPDPLEDWEHKKKSRRSKDGREEEGGGEGDDRGTTSAAQLCLLDRHRGK